jgi:phosphoethanolamine N-methyltransferase
MVRMLELIWGEGYMAPGGPGNVTKLLEGTNPAGKRILDIGCGIGGPAREMVITHGANVVGIDDVRRGIPPGRDASTSSFGAIHTKRSSSNSVSTMPGTSSRTGACWLQSVRQESC